MLTKRRLLEGVLHRMLQSDTQLFEMVLAIVALASRAKLGLECIKGRVTVFHMVMISNVGDSRDVEHMASVSRPSVGTWAARRMDSGASLHSSIDVRAQRSSSKLRLDRGRTTEFFARVKRLTFSLKIK